MGMELINVQWNQIEGFLNIFCCINKYIQSQNTKPHLKEKWGLDNQFMATSRLRVIFLGFFTDFGSFLRHFLSLRTIAQDLRL